jgi:hypothetical protein
MLGPTRCSQRSARNLDYQNQVLKAPSVASIVGVGSNHAEASLIVQEELTLTGRDCSRYDEALMLIGPV